MAFTLDEIREFARNPGKIPAPGTYGEGKVVYGDQMLRELKNQVASGQLPLSEYQELAAPLVKATQAAAVAAAGRGGSGGIWQSLVNDGFGDAGGKLGMPFSRQEYAKLPDAVLPTQQDIQTGMFDPLLAPIQRVRQAPIPQVNPGVVPGTPQPGTTPGTVPSVPQPGTTPGAVTPTNQTGTSPVFTGNPNNPAPDGGLRTDGSSAAADAAKIAQEAALQQQLAVQAANERAGKRKTYLNDLSSLITQQNNQILSEKSPYIQEELNAKGLLRSSELGNAIAREQRGLAEQSANALGQAGLQAEQQDLTDFKEIQNAYNQARDSALGRQFSMEDYERQVRTGRELGDQYAQLKPNAPSKGKAGLSGAATGAVAGAGLGPWGVAGGAVAGGLAGSSKAA